MLPSPVPCTGADSSFGRCSACGATGSLPDAAILTLLYDKHARNADGTPTMDKDKPAFSFAAFKAMHKDIKSGKAFRMDYKYVNQNVVPLTGQLTERSLLSSAPWLNSFHQPVARCALCWTGGHLQSEARWRPACPCQLSGRLEMRALRAQARILPETGVQQPFSRRRRLAAPSTK